VSFFASSIAQCTSRVRMLANTLRAAHLRGIVAVLLDESMHR
jgi:hypothetical protein